VAAAKKVKMWC